MKRVAGLLLALAALAPLAAAVGPVAPPPTFVDATDSDGLRWGISTLALRGWNLVETMGGGGGFVDTDGDGWLDVYLVSYSTRPQADGRFTGDALYRNNRDGTFTDVTEKAGIRGARRGMGLAPADYDGDGRTDLYVSAYGVSVLYRNQGDWTFRYVTDAAGVAYMDTKYSIIKLHRHYRH